MDCVNALEKAMAAAARSPPPGPPWDGVWATLQQQLPVALKELREARRELAWHRGRAAGSLQR